MSRVDVECFQSLCPCVHLIGGGMPGWFVNQQRRLVTDVLPEYPTLPVVLPIERNAATFDAGLEDGYPLVHFISLSIMAAQRQVRRPNWTDSEWSARLRRTHAT